METSSTPQFVEFTITSERCNELVSEFVDALENKEREHPYVVDVIQNYESRKIDKNTKDRLLALFYVFRNMSKRNPEDLNEHLMTYLIEDAVAKIVQHLQEPEENWNINCLASLFIQRK